MRVHRLVMPLIVIVMLLGTVQVSKALDWWQTSGRMLVDMDNFSPWDIRGWMSLAEIAEGAGLQVETLYTILGLPDDIPPATPLMKDLEGIVELSTARYLLADYLGIELDSCHDQEDDHESTGRDEPTPTATSTPVATPTNAPAPTHEQNGGRGIGGGTGAGPTPVPAGQLAPENIKGRMSLREVSEGTGIPLDALLAAANLPADTSPDLALKDLASRIEGFAVQAVRDAAARLLTE